MIQEPACFLLDARGGGGGGGGGGEGEGGGGEGRGRGGELLYRGTQRAHTPHSVFAE